MYIVLRVRRCNQEEELCGFPVQRFKIHAVMCHDHRQAGPLNRLCLCVWDRNAFPDAGRADGLPF